MVDFRGVVLFTLLLPGAARRSTRMSDSGYAQHLTDSLTKTLEVSTDTQEVGFLPTFVQSPQQARLSLPRYGQPLPAGPRRATVDLSAASGPEANDGVSEAKAMVAEAEQGLSRVSRNVSELTTEQSNTQAELDKTFFFRIDKKLRLKKKLQEAKQQLENIAKKASGSNTEELEANAADKQASEQASQEASEQAIEQGKEVTDPEEKKENPLEQIKKFGVAGVLSYALWEGGFWTIGGIGGLFAYFLAFGQWPDLSNQEDAGRVGAEAFAFVNLARFAVPLRIGLAVGTAPWVDENIVKRFGLSKTGEEVDWDSFAEDFKVVDEAGVAVNSLENTKFLLKLVTDTPLNTGSGIETEKLYQKSDNGKPILISNWNFQLQESDVSDAKALEELKKSFEFPLKVKGSSTFKLNEDGKVEQMDIGSWSINGKAIRDMAGLENLKEMAESDEGKLEEWAKGLVS